MKLSFSCPQCDTRRNTRPTLVDLRDDGRYEFTCENGHTTVTVVQEQKFETLFDIGANAILDAYYREAVASFTASLERFYEFFIYALLLDDNTDTQLINRSWKSVSNHSERQLGAYIFLHLKYFGYPPELLTNKETKFRNEVIHKGKIPSKDEAKDYGQRILDLIRPTMRRVKNEFPHGKAQTVLNHINNCKKPEDTGTVSTTLHGTIISLAHGDDRHHEKTIDEALKEKEILGKAFGERRR